MIKRHGEQQYDTTRGILEERRDIHEAHAVVQAAHEKGADQGAENTAAAAGERRAANDRGGNGVELEEEAGSGEPSFFVEIARHTHF